MSQSREGSLSDRKIVQVNGVATIHLQARTSFRHACVKPMNAAMAAVLLADVSGPFAPVGQMAGCVDDQAGFRIGSGSDPNGPAATPDLDHSDGLSHRIEGIIRCARSGTRVGAVYENSRQADVHGHRWTGGRDVSDVDIARCTVRPVGVLRRRRGRQIVVVRLAAVPEQSIPPAQICGRMSCRARRGTRLPSPGNGGSS